MPRAKDDTYFNNFEQSGYAEISGWTPSYYKGIKETDANMRFAGETVDMMAQSLEDFCRNMFVDTMGPEAISRMEAFYKIISDPTVPLEERRRKVNLARNSGHKLSRSLIRTMVTQYMGCKDSEISFGHMLKIMAMVEDDYIVDTKELMAQIRKMLPAHIMVDLREGVRIYCDLLSAHNFLLNIVKIMLKVPFYKYEVLDGGFLLDGSKSLGNEIDEFYPGVLIASGGSKTRSSVVSATEVRVEFSTEEKAELGELLGIYMPAKELVQSCITVSMLLSFSVTTAEEISASVETQKKLWRLDGSETLDSDRALDAYDEKEDL